MRTTLLVDLDDTLYAYGPAEAAARVIVNELVAKDLAATPSSIDEAFVRARKAVKARIDGRGSSHSRLLYFHQMLHDLGRFDAMPRAREWDRAFWGALIARAELRPGAVALLEGWRRDRGKIAVVSDLTLEVQLWKLEAWGLADKIDALVVSEEVPADKPSPAMMELAFARLGVHASDCVMIGDSDEKDGGAARAFDVPFHLVDTGAHSPGRGKSLEAIGRELGVIR